jgi:hypothetical protein
VKLEIPFLSGKQGNSEGKAGDEGQQLIDLLHGKYYHANQLGRVFTNSPTPLGLAIPIYTATALAGGMPIWNPIGSGVKVVPLTFSTTRVSGTSDFGAIGLMARNGMGSVIGTGQQATAFAETVPINGRLGLVNSIAGQGGGQTSRVKSSRAGTVTVTAGVAAEWVLTLGGMNLEADTGTAHQTVPTVYDFDGILEVYPGTMIWIAATKASGALFSTTLTWEEVPL